MNILITGFEPFGTQKINASFEAVKLISDDFSGVTLIKKLVPTIFHQSIAYVKELIDLHQPSIILLIGEAGGSKYVALERVAINVDDARISDTIGQKPVDVPIVDGGENALFSTLPLKFILERLKEKKYKVTLSNSAGTYVCNHLMYGVLHHLSHQRPDKNIMAGFIHVPYNEHQQDEQTDLPFMSSTETADTLHEIIKSILAYNSL